MFVFLINFWLIFVLELFSDIYIKKWVLLSLNVFSLDDFAKAGIFTLGRWTLTALFRFGFEV